MHKVLAKNTLYNLSVSKMEQQYHQSIIATTTLNGNTEKQKLNRIIDYKSQSHIKNTYDISFKIKENKLQLATKYKKQEGLTKQIAKVIDTIDLEVSNVNKPLKIKNHNQVISKWQTLETKLNKHYKGKHAETYFFGLNKRFNNQESLLNNLLQLRNFGAFFMLPFNLYHLNRVYKNKRTIDNMVAKLPLCIDEEFTLTQSSNTQATFEITGTLHENQKYPRKLKNHFSRQNISKENTLKLKEYLGYITLDKTNGLLEEFQLNITISCGENFRKSIQYNTVNKQQI